MHQDIEEITAEFSESQNIDLANFLPNLLAEILADRPQGCNTVRIEKTYAHLAGRTHGNPGRIG